MSDGMSDGRDYGPFLSKHGPPIISEHGKPIKEGSMGLVPEIQTKDSLIVERDRYREALKEIVTRQKTVQNPGRELAVLEAYAALAEELQTIAKTALKGNS